jgi:hypothetical protein
MSLQLIHPAVLDRTVLSIPLGLWIWNLVWCAAAAWLAIDLRRFVTREAAAPDEDTQPRAGSIAAPSKLSLHPGASPSAG